MSLGKVYYDPKHATGFGSVEKLVKASKHKKRDVEVVGRSEHVHFAQTYTKKVPS